MTVDPGTASRSICSLIAWVAVTRKLTPVILPSGRLKLVTSPSWIWVAAGPKDDREFRGRRLGGQSRSSVGRVDHSDLPADQIVNLRDLPTVLALDVSIVDRDVATLLEAHAGKALAKRRV